MTFAEENRTAEPPAASASSSAASALRLAEVVRQATARLAAAGCDTPRLDAEVLLADLLGLDRLHLYLASERRLTPSERDAYEQRLSARVQRQPVAQIVGYREFYGRRFVVRPGVLVPRPETEAVVDEALSCLDELLARGPTPGDGGASCRLLDAGCGSGVIGITLLLERAGTTGVAVDCSPVAYALTTENAQRLGVAPRLQVVLGDWLASWLDPRRATECGSAMDFALVVSNPPYVPAAEWATLAPEIQRWEPKEAVVAGPDGLDAYRHLLPQAFRLLRPGGFCVVEIGSEQVEAVGQLAAGSGFTRPHLGYDGAGRPRVLSWQKPLEVGALSSTQAQPTQTDKTGTTKVVVVGDPPFDPAAPVWQEAGQRIRDGQLVAFPTETVYGLGADATQAAATHQIFVVKGRPTDNPLIVHIERWERLGQVASRVPPVAARLAQAFWPGPLTMVMPRAAQIPLTTTGGLDTVAVRMPSHPAARALIAAADRPIAAPSANRSGRPSPTRAQDVYEDMKGRIPLILDGGECTVGVESTVIDVTVEPPTVLRPGGVTVEMLQQAIGSVQVDPAALALHPATGPVRSPGMRYRHYAPQAPAWLFEGEPEAIVRALAGEITRRRAQHQYLGLLVSAETAAALAPVLNQPGLKPVCHVAGSRRCPEQMAHTIFTYLRQMDREKVQAILIEGIPLTGIGLAVMNRLRKAAGYQIVLCR